MGKLVLLIVIVLTVASCKKEKGETPVFNCDGQVEATSTIRLAATKLAIINMENFFMTGRESGFVPEENITTIANQISAIQNFDEAISDSIFNLYRVPDNFFVREKELREFSILMYGDSALSSLLETGKTGNENIDKLIDKFSIEVKSHERFLQQAGNYVYTVLVKTCVPVNIFSLRRSIEANKPTVLQTNGMTFIKNSGEITISPLSTTNTRYDISIKYIDCPISCKKSHHWVFDVDVNNKVSLVRIYGDPAP